MGSEKELQALLGQLSGSTGKKEIEPGDLACSSCMWVARAIRTTLVQKIPNKVRSPKKKFNLDKEDVCAAKKFPAELVITDYQKIKSAVAGSKRRIADLQDMRTKLKGKFPEEIMEML